MMPLHARVIDQDQLDEEIPRAEPMPIEPEAGNNFWRSLLTQLLLSYIPYAAILQFYQTDLAELEEYSILEKWQFRFKEACTLLFWHTLFVIPTLLYRNRDHIIQGVQATFFQPSQMQHADVLSDVEANELKFD